MPSGRNHLGGSPFFDKWSFCLCTLWSKWAKTNPVPLFTTDFLELGRGRWRPELWLFILNLDGVQEIKGASVPCGVAGCKSPVLGWVCGWSSDPHQGAIMPLLSAHADVVAFFQHLFFSWDGTTGISIRTDKEMWVKALLPRIIRWGMHWV